MKRTDVIVIGAGQAGLAMSWQLTSRGIDHVVIERGRIAERWRSERWDSLRLLTPNWMTRLPGRSYRGPEPDGFMTMPEVTRFFEDYAASFAAPVVAETTVHAVARCGAGWGVATDHGAWSARAVVIATGHCDLPQVPAMAEGMPWHVAQVMPGAYRNPGLLPGGNVLVVGASASGVQIADELLRAGRGVTIAVGRHTRLPRSYRGRDIMWWLDRAGVLDEPIDGQRDIEAARGQPSLQLVGDPRCEALDLGTLHAAGARLVGRALGAAGGRMHFAGDLDETVAAAERRLIRLRNRIDGFIARHPPDQPVPAAEPWRPLGFAGGAGTIDLAAEGITSVVWATGFRRGYRWLKVPALDARGEIAHHHGVTRWPGLYVLGLRFLRTRKSSFIDGVAADSLALAAHLQRHLDAECRVAV
ncbi:NAD(P)-binding domain-containing protein [Limibaculum sp. FT325]|uniref:NAD(P)-binding domain-containing protein n=1 Tax=Thermohalobaculum sediminis TaxID=2939436 RepID=UPI0020BD8D84|nr:NAD(P)-binding domain-containing protein [Limibaculum sediminis]MCL5776252.1 NAD(P)-binding domain-containing protein [Limibaculum sediminis]